MNDILGFKGKNSWASNFAPVEVFVSDIPRFKMRCHSTEMGYQLSKTVNPGERLLILILGKTPGQCKRLGRMITLRSDWDKVRIPIMEDLLRQKFTNPFYKAKLLDTGICYIEETNHWNDTFWGVCNGVGENMMGKLLMKIRADLRSLNGI